VVQISIASLGALPPLAPTGKLPESGGALHNTLLDLDVSPAQTGGFVGLGARVGHASTVGQGKRSRAQATVADLNLTVNGIPIQARFLQAVATAVCDAAGGATATGSSTLTDLVINNGMPVTVGTAANDTVFKSGALVVVANEQKHDPSAGANYGDITVNALHVTAYDLTGAPLAEVIVASAHADIHCGLCTDQGDDFTTGGGWFNAGDPPQARKYFAVAGGRKAGWGHLSYMDKAAGIRFKGDTVLTYDAVWVTEEGRRFSRSLITGRGHFADGASDSYTVTVDDKGEPGDADTFQIQIGAYPAVGGALGGGNIQFHDRPAACAK
jgi:hypothetical protein